MSLRKTRSRQPTAQSKVYGIPIDAVRDKNSASLLPPILWECISYIEAKGLTAEGVFRVSGSIAEVTSLKKDIDEGKSGIIYQCDSVHVVSSLLKMFLRELPEPLLLSQNYDQFIEIQGAVQNILDHPEIDGGTDIEKTEARLEKQKELIDALPPVNRVVLRRLLQLMLNICKHESQNLMSINNLAIVFSSNFLWTDETIGMSSIKMMSDSTKLSNLVTDLADQFDFFFPEPAELDPPSPEVKLESPTEPKEEPISPLIVSPIPEKEEEDDMDFYTFLKTHAQRVAAEKVEQKHKKGKGFGLRLRLGGGKKEEKNSSGSLPVSRVTSEIRESPVGRSSSVPASPILPSSPGSRVHSLREREKGKSRDRSLSHSASEEYEKPTSPPTLSGSASTTSVSSSIVKEVPKEETKMTQPPREKIEEGGDSKNVPRSVKEILSARPRSKSAGPNNRDFLEMALERLERLRRTAGRPPDLESMKPHELRDELSAINRELRLYESYFEQQNGTLPTHDDWSKLSLLVNRSGDCAVQGLIELSNREDREDSDAEDTESEEKTAEFVEPLSPLNDPKFRQLKLEKRRIQMFLHKYQNEFETKNGRKMSTREDRAPIQVEYDRYKQGFHKMHLYSLTLQRSTAIYNSIAGNFSSPKLQELVVSRGKILELLRQDENGRYQTVLSTEIFGLVRALAPFRLTGGSKDYIIVGSDSGKIVILEYNVAKNRFDRIHEETFGKSGCRRVVPGHFLAADPKGRAVMIGAVEKQKLVYILNRDSAAKLTISSPLEAHKAHTILFTVTGLDVGFENPIFACIESNYEEEDALARFLVYYELDLGLNHVVRKWNEQIDQTSSHLISVPGGTDGPGGVLVCAENIIYWIHQGHNQVKAVIPRREGSNDDQGLMIISSTFFKRKDLFFFLVQTEYGDLIKLSLTVNGAEVTGINMTYFDTIPPSNSINMLKNGSLFSASEFGNHYLYSLAEIGDNQDISDPMEVRYFKPRKLQYLQLADSMNSLSPIIEMKILDLYKEDTPQIYAICGRGYQSALRVLRHGIAPMEIAESPLPGNPSAVWTVKKSSTQKVDDYIVVSFVNATLVLTIGASVEEAVDTGMLTTSTSIHVANIGDDGFIQVHPMGIRHIRNEKGIHEWKTPGKKSISHATSNESQVVIALSGGDLLYFELDQLGQLIEIEKKFIGREVSCLAIAPLLPGRARTRFVAVGDWENNVRVFSLDSEDCLQVLSIQSLPTHSESLCIVNMSNTANDASGTLFLTIGLNNGILLRTVIDSITGELSDTRSRLTGSRAVKLVGMKVKGTNAFMALSSRAWLAYNDQSTLRYQMVPLSYVPLESAATFCSDNIPEGIVAISGSTLRILVIDRLGATFNQSDIPLLHTPRHFIPFPDSNNLIIIESDHNAAKVEEDKVKKEEDDMAVETLEEEKEEEELPFEKTMLAEIKPGNGKWASCIRIVSPRDNGTLDLIHLDDNEAAISLCTCIFKERGNEVLLVVGTAKDMYIKPRSYSGGMIHVYRVVEGKQLELMHKTPVEVPPSALHPFQGRLLVGAGNLLRIYDIGKKKLLKKCEYKSFPNVINKIDTQGERIYVTDIQESVHFVKYRKADNQLYIFADHPTPRSITSMSILDYDSIVCSDKFGNIFISRLPAQVSEEMEEDPTGAKLQSESGYLNGAPYKLEDLAMFHVGETVNCVTKASLVPGASEVVAYSTLAGSIGILVPFVSREDVDFFQHLEMQLRLENLMLTGRDHLSFRSYYFPVKDIVDGDLCEQFVSLDADKQASIAGDLDRTPMEVIKKLEDIRNRLL
ncbi:hypothetical protein PROFUN_11061 [Planoprotostelium fungivorum]|uniref:Rho-GAP domain-containing protein n=1 Tax=Planoprotostelium fungivorum TaxID=1890364 RepID=A0A2P6NBN6_9EUKA|nr:hypothetical protein PROFUN_11061 [Planoprotostelium fungivorum]